MRFSTAASARLSPILLLAAASLTWAAPEKEPPAADKPPILGGGLVSPADLTPVKVREWAIAAIAVDRIDPKKAEFWKDLDALVEIDGGKIIYESEKGVPIKLLWVARPRRNLTAEERLRAKEGLQKVAHYVFFEHEKGLLGGGDAEQLKNLLHAEVEAPPEPPPAIVVKPDESERLRRELEEARGEIERLRTRISQLERAERPTRPERNVEPRRYYMVIQPSSMIYYDPCAHCWVPGAASVEYYPADAGDAPRLPRPTPPAFVPPAPRSGPGLPPPERPAGAGEAPRLEEADRVFWVGYRSYWQGDYDRALTSFDGAIRLDAEDARFWYYKALAERALSDTARAEQSAQRGRELHAAHKAKADQVSKALERVQGQERRFLNAPEIVVSEASRD